MKGTLLRFYVHENRRHHHALLYDWLLEQARQLGIRGGSAFRAIAGYGRHGVMHEEHFFELAGEGTIEVELATTEDEAERMLAIVQAEDIRLFYIRVPAEFDSTGNGNVNR